MKVEINDFLFESLKVYEILFESFFTGKLKAIMINNERKKVFLKLG